MKYGFLITTYNDAKEAVEMFQSLKKSIPPNEDYGVCVVDGGSNSENVKLIESEIGAIQDQHEDLSSALNLGYDTLLKCYADYIFWIHTDCIFYQYDWANKLINIYNEIWPLVGRMGPATSNIDSSIQSLQQGEILREANQCPTLMSAECIRNVISKYGFLYDPKYTKIGGLEDICLWIRLKEMGYLSCICSLVDVWHQGGGIRFSKGRDTRLDQIHNREIFHQKYGDSIYNDILGPVCDINLSEINKNLINKFSNLKDEIINLIPERNKISENMKGKFYEREYNK